MIKNIAKTICGLVAFAGFIVVLGVAGADCDGKCMENAMPIGDMILYTLGGIAMIGLGALGLAKIPE